MRIASIDIGTNTILLLIVDFDDSGKMNVVKERQVIARLGRGVDSSGTIEPQTIARCVEFLRDYAGEIKRHGAEHVVAAGTSALRDAANRQEFISRIFEVSGIRVELLSAEDEAKWSYVGAISGTRDRFQSYAVLDIGGGSTELVLGDERACSAFASIDIGAVRLTERFLRASPPIEEELSACDAHIRNAISALPAFDSRATCFIGVAGTVTTLAALQLGMETYNPDAIANFALTRSMVLGWYDRLRPMNPEQLLNTLSVDPGRADVILAGVMILAVIMEHRQVETCIVSERGLRYGLAARTYREFREPEASL